MQRACLVIEADTAFCSALHEALCAHSIRPLRAEDAERAIEILRQVQVDLIVYDADHHGDGYIDVLRALVTASRVPVLVLGTVRDEVDQIIAIELGAADVLSKPVSVRLVVAKIKRLLRAAPDDPFNAVAHIDVGALRLNLRMGVATWHDEPIRLTVQEFELLFLLATRQGQLVGRETISRVVRGLPNEDSRCVDVTVSRLRRKLRDQGVTAVKIGTLYGRGYFLAPAHVHVVATANRAVSPVLDSAVFGSE